MSPDDTNPGPSPPTDNHGARPPENGRRATHNYREPGTYTATVTATDSEGASSSAEVEITVTEEPVNLAPGGAGPTPRESR